MAGASGSELSRGGMQTKIEAAKIATTGGTHMVIASGSIAHPLQRDRQRALHLVPDAGQSGDGAQEMDRRLARAEGHADDRCRRGRGAAPRQQPAAGRHRQGRRRFRARRRRDRARAGRRAKSAAASSPTTPRMPRRSAASRQATCCSFSALRAAPRWCIATTWCSGTHRTFLSASRYVAGLTIGTNRCAPSRSFPPFPIPPR